MIHVSTPGEVCDLRQWVLVDQISDEQENETFKITTKQAFQFHGVKCHFKPVIQGINRTPLDTLAACGDVNRFVSLARSLWSFVYLIPL